MRGYILVGLVAANFITSLLVVFMLLFYLELEENTSIAIGLDVVCVIGYGISLYILKKTENFMLCSNFLIAILAVVIFIGVQITGGYLYSPILQLALQIPLTAFLLMGFAIGCLLARHHLCHVCRLLHECRTGDRLRADAAKQKPYSNHVQFTPVCAAVYVGWGTHSL